MPVRPSGYTRPDFTAERLANFEFSVMSATASSPVLKPSYHTMKTASGSAAMRSSALMLAVSSPLPTASSAPASVATLPPSVRSLYTRKLSSSFSRMATLGCVDCLAV